MYDIVLKLMKRKDIHRTKYTLLDVVSRHCRLFSVISVTINLGIGQGLNLGIGQGHVSRIL